MSEQLWSTWSVAAKQNTLTFGNNCFVDKVELECIKLVVSAEHFGLDSPEVSESSKWFAPTAHHRVRASTRVPAKLVWVGAAP